MRPTPRSVHARQPNNSFDAGLRDVGFWRAIIIRRFPRNAIRDRGIFSDNIAIFWCCSIRSGRQLLKIVIFFFFFSWLLVIFRWNVPWYGIIKFVFDQGSSRILDLPTLYYCLIVRVSQRCFTYLSWKSERVSVLLQTTVNQGATNKWSNAQALVGFLLHNLNNFYLIQSPKYSYHYCHQTFLVH